MSAYNSFAVTVTGGSHIKKGKECQDASIKGESNSAAVAIISDGHGDDNCFRSAKGADLAVKCTAKGIIEFIKIHEPGFGLFKNKDTPLLNDPDKALRDLIKHIIALWHENVEKDYNVNPFTPEELEKADEKNRKRFEEGKRISKAYGATLIAAAVTKHYWFGFHLGDGRFTALYRDGSYDQPVPWDEKCYLNVTTSICDDDACDQARVYFSFIRERPAPAAVFICSDGIDDNYPVEGNEHHLFKLYRTIALTFAKDGFDSTCTQLKDLANAFATKGKGDDTSIAGFIDMENINLAAPIWQKQVDDEEKEAAEKADAEKEAREKTEAIPDAEKEATEKEADEEEPETPVCPNQSAAVSAYEKQMKPPKESVLNYLGSWVSGKKEK